MAEKIVLIGAGGHANTVLDSAMGHAYAFVDKGVKEFFGLKKLEEASSGDYAIISFGAVVPEELQRRHDVFERYVKAGVKFVSVIHPQSIVSDKAKIGDGTLVAPGVIVNAAAKVGKNVILNSGCIIEHGAEVGDGTHIAPGAVILGSAKVGKNAMIGAGAVVLPYKSVPDNTMVKSLTRFPH